MCHRTTCKNLNSKIGRENIDKKLYVLELDKDFLYITNNMIHTHKKTLSIKDKEKSQGRETSHIC